MTRSLEDRLSDKLEECDNGCWKFIGCRNPKGYGKIGVGRVCRLTHRVSWELHFGPIPMGMLVLHKCDEPACCNPEHLKLGTDQDNCDDKFNKKRNYNSRGGEHGNAVLNEEKVLQIKRFLLTKQYTQVELADMFGVVRQVIWGIAHGKAWKHVILDNSPLGVQA